MHEGETLSRAKIQLNNQDSVILHLVVVHYPLRYGLVQHLLVPLLQALRLWDLLIRRVTVEDVVVSFAGWAGPDVSSGVAEVGGRTDTTGAINTNFAFRQTTRDNQNVKDGVI